MKLLMMCVNVRAKITVCTANLFQDLIFNVNVIFAFENFRGLFIIFGLYSLRIGSEVLLLRDF